MNFEVTFSLCVTYFFIKFASTGEISRINAHKKWQLLPSEDCGIVKTTRRIVGGNEAYLGQFPWMARLGYKYTSGMRFKCGGSIINPFYVLTAAHCIHGWEPRLKIVRLGENFADSDEDCENDFCAPPLQDIHIEKNILHPKYDSLSSKNDIALIRLQTAIEYNVCVQPICLPRGNALLKEYVAGEVEVAGWGRIESSIEISAKTLIFVKLPIRGKCVCEKVYHGIDLDSSQFCIGLETGEDSCSGDSGGPAMKTEYSLGIEKYFILGVVSFGKLYCGRAPSVYANVIKYIDWILDSIHEGKDAPQTYGNVLDFTGNPDNWKHNDNDDTED